MSLWQCPTRPTRENSRSLGRSSHRKSRALLQAGWLQDGAHFCSRLFLLATKPRRVRLAMQASAAVVPFQMSPATPHNVVGRLTCFANRSPNSRMK